MALTLAQINELKAERMRCRKAGNDVLDAATARAGGDAAKVKLEPAESASLNAATARVAELTAMIDAEEALRDTRREQADRTASDPKPLGAGEGNGSVRAAAPSVQIVDTESERVARMQLRMLGYRPRLPQLAAGGYRSTMEWFSSAVRQAMATASGGEFRDPRLPAWCGIEPSKRNWKDETAPPELQELRGEAGRPDPANPTTGAALTQLLYVNALYETALGEGQLLSRIGEQPGVNVPGLDGILLPRVKGDKDRRAGAEGIHVGYEEDGVPGDWSTVKIDWHEVRHVNISGLIRIPERIVRDSYAVAAYVLRRLPKRARQFMETDVAWGVGGRKPFGFIGAGAATVKQRWPGTIYVPRQTAGKISADDVMAMDSHLDPESSETAVWIATKEAQTPLEKLVVATGASSGELVGLLPANGLIGRPFATLRGRAVLFADHVAAPLGSTGDLALIDLSRWVAVQRPEPEMAMSTDFFFDTRDTAFRFVVRFGGAPEEFSPTTGARPPQFANIASWETSPYVVLSDAA